MVKFRELAMESPGHSGSDKGSPGATGCESVVALLNLLSTDYFSNLDASAVRRACR